MGRAVWPPGKAAQRHEDDDQAPAAHGRRVPVYDETSAVLI